ncbi:MAG TPA: DUF3261 domain-containing protein [Nevskiaceae bacterium]|nr:DUF3261 domain-containing protein [Nevskiaceae bacterium]
MLSACAILPRRPLPRLPLLPPQALGVQRQATQVLHAAYGAHEMTLQCALDARTSKDTLVALGPFGQRLFTLHYDAKGVRVKSSPYVPARLPARRIWADVELALWPASAWQRRLAGTDWHLTEPLPGVRRLRYGDRLVTEVHYDADSDGWNGRFWLVDWPYDYSLEISSTAG